MVSINSSTKGDFRTLAKAVEFLRELANLRDEDAAIQRFEMNWSWVFENEVPAGLVNQWAIRAEEEDAASLSAKERLREYWLLPLRASVRHLWGCDPRSKQWGIFSILERFFGVGFRDPETGPWTTTGQWHQGRDLPTESSCEQIFSRLSDRTSVCQNEACPARYYFPRRAGQKYCSEECAAPAQRTFKKNWWKREGPAWRARRARRLRSNRGRKKIHA